VEQEFMQLDSRLQESCSETLSIPIPSFAQVTPFPHHLPIFDYGVFRALEQAIKELLGFLWYHSDKTCLLL